MAWNEVFPAADFDFCAMSFPRCKLAPLLFHNPAFSSIAHRLWASMPKALLLQPGFAQHRRHLGRSEILQKRVRLNHPLRRRQTPGGKYRRALQIERDRSDDFDAWDLLQFADLLHRQLGLAG